MKFFAAMMIVAFSTAAYSQTYVKGYTRKNGTYVAPHYRSSPDGNKDNNWSTEGNVNPYTGKEGTKKPSYEQNSYGGSSDSDKNDSDTPYGK